MNREAIKYREFDWFAVDGDGHIGHFSTAGFGPVPAAVLAHLDDLLNLSEQVLILPVIGGATGHLPGQIDDWMEMARRGLFSYDWQHWSGPYRLAATPSTPIRIDEVSPELRQLVSAVRWPEIQFEASTAIRPEDSDLASGQPA